MPDRTLAAAFDTASDLAGVALIEDGRLLAEVTWRTRQNHSRELLPSLDWLLGRLGRTKHEIGAFICCTGPGSYAGMRVGASTAKALAFSLDAAVIGIGRLLADAEPLVAVTDGRVVAVHAAGRAELAWAAYSRGEGEPREELPPQLGTLEALLDVLHPGDLVCADLATLQPAAHEALSAKARLVEAPAPRVSAVARLGASRFARGLLDDVEALVPLYLRAPAIGPQS